MTTRTSFGPLLMAMVMLAACGDITGIEADLTPEILSGDWEATSLTVTNLANPAQSIDLLESGGAFELRFTADGEVTQFFTPPGGETQVESATYEIDPPFLLFTSGDQVDAFAYELQSTQTGNSLTIATTDLEFLFEGNDEPVPALFAGVFIR